MPSAGARGISAGSRRGARRQCKNVDSMRIIAGSLKGRRLKSPTWDGLRPTSDRLRETLFNVLMPRVSGARVVDGYAGTGALGIEAISRGAAHVTFIESDRRAQVLVAENLEHCGISEGYAIIRSAVARAFETLRASAAFVPFDIMLLDPPYDQQPAGVLAGADALLAPHGLIVVEHARRQPAPVSTERLVRVRQLVAGDSTLSFYGRIPGLPPSREASAGTTFEF
jgi:16S rRNA (guanine966-N2)-methyltransferase